MTSRSTARTLVAPAAVASFAFAALAYAAFVAVSVYAVGFVAGHGVPRSVDRGGPRSSAATAALIDVLLVLLFAAHHSVMARPAVKRASARFVPRQVERSLYVLAASVTLAVMFWQWRPIPRSVWETHIQLVQVGAWLLFGAGWLLAIGTTFAIDHLDLLGITQVRRYVRGLGDATARFRLPLPYRLARHPMMTGFFVAFLATPHMTAGHLLFTASICGYVLLGVRLEERDLYAALPEYADYAARTPRFVPLRRRR